MRVGLIGVGYMGKGIANRLLMAPPSTVSQVLVFDADRMKLQELSEELQHAASHSTQLSGNKKTSLVVCDSPKAVAEGCDMLALSLPSIDATRDVLFGHFGVSSGMSRSSSSSSSNSSSSNSSSSNSSSSNSRSRKIVMDHGTFTREFILENHARASKSELFEYIDAPVSGGPQGAKDGTLTVMIGGPESTILECTPILECYSRKILRFGDVGAGMAAKLINQALVGVHALAASEAIFMAESFGINSPEGIATLRSMLQASWGQSKVLDLCLEDYIKARNHGSNDILLQTSAPLRNLRKDFSCIKADMAVATNKDDILKNVLQLVGTTDNLFDEAKNIGLDNSAFVSLLQLLHHKNKK